jgi:hypothetical protein
MKVIFLDHDGVICLYNNYGTRFKKQKKYYKDKENPKSVKDINISIRFDDFDKKSVKVLNDILEETGAEIVVSSDWRTYASLEEIGDYYELQGIIKRPIDVTDFYSNLGIGKKITFSEYLEKERYFEIKDWLEKHPDVTHWVAVDDLHMGKFVENSSYGPFEKDWGLDNFVWTPIEDEGIKQCNIKEKIIHYLK